MMHRCSSLQRGKNFFISNLKCTCCGSTMPIPRTRRQREAHHVKDLYCVRCKAVTPHEEQREFDYADAM